MTFSLSYKSFSIVRRHQPRGGRMIGKRFPPEQFSGIARLALCNSA